MVVYGELNALLTDASPLHRTETHRHAVIDKTVCAVHLPAHHRHLVPEHEQSDVLGTAVAGDWLNIRRICAAAGTPARRSWSGIIPANKQSRADNVALQHG